MNATLLALSDSDLLALCILAVALSAGFMLGGGLFWVMVKNGRKAKAEALLMEGLEDIWKDDEPEPTNSSRTDKVSRQDWEKDADWWKQG